VTRGTHPVGPGPAIESSEMTDAGKTPRRAKKFLTRLLSTLLGFLLTASGFLVETNQHVSRMAGTL